MSEALDPREIDGLGADLPAFARRIAGEQYEADPKAYAVDTDNDPVKAFCESVDAGASITLNLACRDGRREIVELDRQESHAWVRGTLSDRTEFANRKICERRFDVAARAAERLQERGLPPTSENLRPDEEAYLNEFGAIVERRAPLKKGGYRRLKPTFSEAFVGAMSDTRLREDFFDGIGDGGASAYFTAPTQREYLPVGGPAGQQLQISDVWDEQAKVYYAYTHDTVARDAVEMLADFILGRGVQIVAADEKVQKVIDEFVAREKFDQRAHQMTSTLIQAGELFVRKMPIGGGRLKVRTLPAETIWEIVTDAEDALEVFWYVQRFQTRTVLFADNKPEAATRWVERTILAGDMLHPKINARESDVRGRSDMYPALGWMKRLRDYFDAVVQKEYSAAAYQWHLKVKGGAGDVSAIAAAAVPGGQVPPGSTLVTNDQVDQQAMGSGVRAVSGNGSTYEALLNTIALAFGLTKEYFGASSHTNRASAIVATEPAAKRFEHRQDVLGDFFREIFQAVVDEAAGAGLLDGAESLDFKIIFPTIVKADATSRMSLLNRAESMGYISKQTAAENAASELELEDYDFEDEQQKIKDETGTDGRNVISRDMAQVFKGGPTSGEPAWDPGEVPNPAAGGGGTDPAAPQDNAGPSSATGAKKGRDELGRKSMERAIAEARKSGGIVIIP